MSPFPLLRCTDISYIPFSFASQNVTILDTNITGNSASSCGKDLFDAAES
jgi:hypothetical protein